MKVIDRDTIKLLRIPFSYFLMPVYFLALSQSTHGNLYHAILVFFILHLFIYPASNGYNSYMDNDETSIGGLEHPPKPTKKLFYAALVFDGAGLLLSLFINWRFFVCVLMYMLASRAYSYKGIRLKKYAIIGFLTVVCFQGAFTFFMVHGAINGFSLQDVIDHRYVLIAASLLIAGVYPLTQIYQHEADHQNGDDTISYRLGHRGTFIFSACMFIAASVCLYFHYAGQNSIYSFWLLQTFLAPVLLYFIWWFLQVCKNTTNANFANTMRMNWLASTAMNICFITMLFIH